MNKGETTICSECGASEDSWDMCPMSSTGEGPHRFKRVERFDMKTLEMMRRTAEHAEDGAREHQFLD